MMLASVLHLLLASAAGDLGTPPARRRANGTDFRRQYFSRPVRRPGAVNEAVELLTQQEAARLAADPARPPATTGFVKSTAGACRHTA